MGSKLLESPLLRASAPYSLAGYARMRAVIDTDGALPAALKALFLAVAASTKRYPDLAQRELARAHGLGLDYAHASAAAAVLCSVRGEGAALAFIELLERKYPGQQVQDVELLHVEVEAGDAERNFRAYFGTLPASLEKLLRLLPQGADGYYLMREGTINGTSLGARNAELMLVTVLAADYSPLVAVHAEGARRMGASEQELAEAILCAVPTAGLSAWVSGSEVLAAWVR